MNDNIIEVTSGFVGWAEGFRGTGLKWAYRVVCAGQEVIGATADKRDAWREARAMMRRLERMAQGACSQVHTQYRERGGV